MRLIPQTVCASEYMADLCRNLPKELKSIPKPYFLSRILPEHPIAVCRPLMTPFDDFAISHSGIVFKYRPLNILTTPYGNIIHPQNICAYKYRHNDARPIVVLSTSLFQKRFFVHRLVLERFYGVGLNERVEVSYIDGNESNPHMTNLEAFFKRTTINRRVPEYEDDRHEWCPVH